MKRSALPTPASFCTWIDDGLPNTVSTSAVASDERRCSSLSITVISFASRRSILARWEPTSPAPSMTIFISSQIFENPLAAQCGLQHDVNVHQPVDASVPGRKGSALWLPDTVPDRLDDILRMWRCAQRPVFSVCVSNRLEQRELSSQQIYCCGAIIQNHPLPYASFCLPLAYGCCEVVVKQQQPVAVVQL